MKPPSQRRRPARKKRGLKILLLLAIPLTATLKVLLARYVLGPRLREEVMENIEEVPVVRHADPGPEPQPQPVR